MVKSVAEVRAELTAPGQLFEMDTIHIGGVPIRVWKNAPGTLRNVLDLSSLHGDKTLVVYEDETVSFADHYRQASTFAHRLIDEYGVQKGDRVALAMRNFPEWLVAFWGATAAGAIIVPLNAWWTGPELEYGIQASGASEQATLLSVPLFHVTGCHAIMLSSIAFGAKLVIMYKWDPDRALELIERERITTIGGVPAMIWQLLESPNFESTDTSSVK